MLGANDGIVSTASLVLGVAAADSNPRTVLIAGVAGLAAGSMSMAAGEYVSVSSQSDTEEADLALERRELASNEAGELEELVTIYVARGLDRSLAEQVAAGLTAHDALGAHARDELGLSHVSKAQPIQAAWTSAGSFAVGAVLPLFVLIVSPKSLIVVSVAAASLASLALLGGLAAKAGGAGIVRGSLRVTLWGALAMALTSAVGKLFGIAL